MLLASDVPMPVGYFTCLPCSLDSPGRALPLSKIANAGYALLACGGSRLEIHRAAARRLAEPGAKLLTVLAERRRRQRVARRRPGKRDGMSDHGHRLVSRANLDDGIKAEFLGELDAAFDSVDGTAGHARVAQPAKPLAGRSGAQPLNQQWAQCFAVMRAIFCRCKSGIMHQFRKAENLAQLAELPVVPGGDHQFLIRRWQRFVGE